MLLEMRPQLLESFIRRIGPMNQLFVLLGNRAPLGHRLEVDDFLPVLAAVQDDGNLLRELVGLGQRQNLEELVAGAKPSRKNHERLCQIGEPELPHEEVVKLEVKAVGDVV